MRHTWLLSVLLLLTLGCADHQMRANAHRKANPIIIGMTSEDVLTRWGQPERVRRVTTAQGLAEDWYYRTGSDVLAVGRRSIVTSGRYVWLRFEAGRLVAVVE